MVQTETCPECCPRVCEMSVCENNVQDCQMQLLCTRSAFTNACSCSQCDNKAEYAESEGEEAENDDDDETSEDELDDNDV